MKKLTVFAVTLFIVFLLLFSPVLFGGEESNADKKNTAKKGYDFEHVNVVNIKIPVRVYQHGKPVDGLKKSDFKIFENGKERPVNGFFIEKKTLRLAQSEYMPVTSGKDSEKAPKPVARLFVLIFNISSDNIDIQGTVDKIFEEIIHPGDRIIVLTNSYILQEKEVKNIYLIKKEVKGMVKRDVERVVLTRIGIENKLRFHVNTFFKGLDDPLSRIPAELLFREYYRGYIEALEEAKWEYFGMTMEEYFKLADYLKKQDREKWVFNFYQTGFFPKPKSYGRFRRRVEALLDENYVLKSLTMEFNSKLTEFDDWRSNMVAKMFLNSGATFHTMLMKPKGLRSTEHFEYAPIATSSENILRNVTRKTGGKLMHSLVPEKFVAKIVNKEDISYVLTYVPAADRSKNVDVNVKLTKPGNYNVVFNGSDNQGYLRRLAAKMKKITPRISIGEVAVRGGNVYALISNIKTSTINSKSAKQKTGQVEARILILNDKSKPVFESTKNFVCKQKKSVLKVKHPVLPKGHYDVIVEVKDLNTWKSDMNGIDITI